MWLKRINTEYIQALREVSKEGPDEQNSKDLLGDGVLTFDSPLNIQRDHQDQTLDENRSGIYHLAIGHPALYYRFTLEKPIVVQHILDREVAHIKVVIERYFYHF